MEHIHGTVNDAINDLDNFSTELSSHLEAHYGIQVTKIVSLDTNVFRVDQASYSSWIARIFSRESSLTASQADYSAKTLSFLQRCGFPAERCAHETPVSNFRGREVLVTEFLPGGRPKICTETFHRLGDLLGQLHTLPFSGEAVSWKGGAWHHRCSHGGPHEEIAAALALVDRMKLRIPVEEYAVYRRLQIEFERIDNFADLPESLIHPDFVPII